MIALTTSLVMIATIEVALRLTTDFPIHKVSYNIYDPILKYKIDSKFKNIDSNGFRNPSALEQADIVAIGDSHTFGVLVPPQYAWPQQLASLTGLTTYNFSTPSYGIFQYITLFDRAVKMKPEYIILGLYPINDFQSPIDFIHLPYWREWLKQRLSPSEYSRYLNKSKKRKKIKNRHFASLKKVKRYLRNHSALYSAFIHLEKKSTLFKQEGMWLFECPHFKKFFDKNRLSSTDKFFPIPSYEERIRLRLALTELGKMKEKSDQNNIRFILAIIPSVENACYNHIIEEGAELPDFFQETVLAEREVISNIIKFSKNLNITTVEIRPELERALESNPNIYPIYPEGHSLRNGYTAYANAVYNSLQALAGNR